MPEPASPSQALPRLAGLLLLAALLLWLPGQAGAWRFTEWGLGVFAHNDIDIQGANLGGTGLDLDVAGALWEGAGLRLDLRLEGSVAKFWNYANGLEVSLAPGLRLYLPSFGEIGAEPFLEGGLGPSWDNLHIDEVGSALNFLSFGGIGLRLPLEGSKLELGYRLRHISNGGLDERNHGVTSNLLRLALVWEM